MPERHVFTRIRKFNLEEVNEYLCEDRAVLPAIILVVLLAGIDVFVALCFAAFVLGWYRNQSLREALLALVSVLLLGDVLLLLSYLQNRVWDSDTWKLIIVFHAIMPVCVATSFFARQQIMRRRAQ